MSSSIDNENGDHGFQIAPMVDIVFVLLLFFMTYKTVRELHVEATPSGVPGSSTVMPIVLDIATDESISVNGTVVSASADSQVDGLSQWLSRIRTTTPPNEAFVIRADGQARHERITRVVAALNKAGYKRILFS